MSTQSLDSNMTSNKKVISGFDLLKFLMALVIINIHLNLVDYADATWLSVPWSYVNDMAVPSFFILSSFFLFSKMREDYDREERQRRLWHYEWRLAKLYLFWVVALSPIILYCWHPEFLSSIGVFLFVKNFFFGYEFGASWFFGALLVGVPIITMLRHIANDKITLIIAFVVYFYLYSNMMDRGLYELYENLLRDPKLSFPAGLLWISIGAVISNQRIVCWVEKTKLPILISGGNFAASRNRN